MEGLMFMGWGQVHPGIYGYRWMDGGGAGTSMAQALS